MRIENCVPMIAQCRGGTDGFLRQRSGIQTEIAVFQRPALLPDDRPDACQFQRLQHIHGALPATALARIVYALREGWLLEQNDESRVQGTPSRLALDQTGASDTDIETTVWLRQADGTPFLGEIAVDGETILTVRFTAFGFCDTITDNS